MYYLHRDDETWERCITEKNGWIGAAKERNLYRDNDDHFHLPDGRPHLAEFYRESKMHLDAFTRVESLNGKLCLDLGACLGWVEAYLLGHHPDATLIALEVNDDPFCGLGRAQALKDRLNVEFVSLVADMHCIPLQADSVDVVFSVDALHHFRNLDAVFREVRRVLRPGGAFYGLNEPDRPEGTDENEYTRSHIDVELRHGIIERRPTIREYLQAGDCLNLAVANNAVALPQSVATGSLFLKGTRPAQNPLGYARPV